MYLDHPPAILLFLNFSEKFYMAFIDCWQTLQSGAIMNLSEGKYNNAFAIYSDQFLIENRIL